MFCPSHISAADQTLTIIIDRLSLEKSFYAHAIFQLQVALSTKMVSAPHFVSFL